MALVTSGRNVPDPGLIASGYEAMADRTALKVLVQP